MPESRHRKPGRQRPGPARDRTGQARRRPQRREEERPEPAPSARYTPARSAFRIRPVSHKIVGWVLVSLAVAVAILNDVQWVSSTLRLLPGGHSELYLLLALAIAVFGMWWLGVFDRPLSS